MSVTSVNVKLEVGNFYSQQAIIYQKMSFVIQTAVAQTFQD